MQHSTQFSIGNYSTEHEYYDAIQDFTAQLLHYGVHEWHVERTNQGYRVNYNAGAHTQHALLQYLMRQE